MGAKIEFQSIEDVVLHFEPFVDRTNNGERIESGDTINNVVIKRPSGALLAGGDIPVFTRDADSKHWKATIPKALFEVGVWEVRITSSNAGSEPQYRTIHWGLGAPEMVLLVKRLIANRRRTDRAASQVIIYADDGTTPLVSGTYKDQNGNATVGTLEEGDVHEQTALV